MWTRAALPSDLPDLVHGMNDQDAREIYALRDHRDPFALIGELANALPYALIAEAAGLDGEPRAIAFLAVWPEGRPAVLGRAALFATGRFRRIARPLIAHVRANVIPSLLARGVRRVEARCMTPHITARSFLLRCGAIWECTLPDLGPDDLSYEQFAWRRREWRLSHVPDPATQDPVGDLAGSDRGS